MKIKFLVLTLLISFNGFTQETKDSKWAFGLSNGHSQSRVNAENNLLNTSVDAFYIDRYEWFSLRPEIRLNTKFGFWSLRLDDFNNGDKYWKNTNGQSNYNIYRNRDFTFSKFQNIKSWTKARIMAGLSFGYNYDRFNRNGNYGREEERRHTMNLGFSPMYRFSISEHIQLEFATDFRITEFAKVHEAFFSNYNQWFEINDYQYIMALNGFAFSLNFVYQL